LGWRPAHHVDGFDVTVGVSAFSDESWGGDLGGPFNRSDMVEVSAFSDESWGGDPQITNFREEIFYLFQHSLMNLGVETCTSTTAPASAAPVSAFSDESWGGDRM